jgi:hypothetical protein
MSSSNYKKCKNCGQLIQFRKMPHGRYVAFEGYDTVHTSARCKEYQKGLLTRQKTQYKPNPPDKSSYENLDFPEIQIGQNKAPTFSVPTSPTYKNTDKQSSSKPYQPPINKKSKIEIPIWIWMVLIVIVFCILSPLFDSLSTSPKTPTTIPRSTATLKPTSLSPIDIASTQSANCLSWKKVTVSMEGEQKCVYGIVVQRKTLFSTDGNYSWFLIRFDDNPSTFYLTSDFTLNILMGECIVGKGNILVDINGVPNMKVNNLIECSIEMTP